MGLFGDLGTDDCGPESSLPNTLEITTNTLLVSSITDGCCGRGQIGHAAQ